MPDSDLEKKLVRDLRALFPQEAMSTDRWLLDRGYDPTENNVALTWVEAFAETTNDAVRRKDSDTVKAHTTFFAMAYRAEPTGLRTMVDVSYAENILWDVEPKDRLWAWEFIAADIQALYEGEWGNPTLGQN